MTEVHPSAVIDSDVQLGKNVTVGPNTVIESGVVIGDDTFIDCNVFIGRNATIGKNNQFYPNCLIGAQPQVLGAKRDQVTGGVVIGDNNVIREMVTIHNSMYADAHTSVGSNNLIMVGVHLGHDCILDDNIVMSNYAQLGGHCKVETGAWLSGMVVVHQFCTIGKWCYAAGLTGINHDIPPYMIVSGHYPSKVRGVNKRGLARAGLNDEQQKQVMDAYKKLFRNASPLLENAKALVKEDDWDHEITSIAEFIIKSSEQRFGRYLELFRH